MEKSGFKKIREFTILVPAIMVILVPAIMVIGIPAIIFAYTCRLLSLSIVEYGYILNCTLRGIKSLVNDSSHPIPLLRLL